MKASVFVTALVLSLFAPLSQAQSDNECLISFTQDYFEWFKGTLHSSASGPLKDRINAEKEELTELLNLLRKDNSESCSSTHETQINGLIVETENLFQILSALLKDVEAGAAFSMGDEVMSARSKYRAYNAKLVKNLMYETGIRW